MLQLNKGDIIVKIHEANNKIINTEYKVNWVVGTSIGATRTEDSSLSSVLDQSLDNIQLVQKTKQVDLHDVASQMSEEELKASIEALRARRGLPKATAASRRPKASRPAFTEEDGEHESEIMEQKLANLTPEQLDKLAKLLG